MTDVVQVSFHLDRERRSPEALLDAWHALPGCAIAAARAGVDIAIVQPAAIDSVMERNGVAFHFVREHAGLRRGTPGTRPVTRNAPAIARAAAALRPRLIHVQGLSLPGHMRALSRRLPGVRVVAQDHADGLPRPWRMRAARRDLECLDAVLFTAAGQARPFFETGLFRSDLSVHEVLEASIAGEVPVRPGSARRPASFVWLGRLDANKDPLTVLAGFAAGADRFPDARLRMCYLDAPLLADVRECIRRNPVLSSRVDLLGHCSRDEVLEILSDSDFLLQGSHREGSGYAVIEALACGVTPIVTSIPSLRAIVGDAGYLWPPGDTGALAECLALAAAADRNRLERVARRRFERSLSWDAVGRQLAAAYDAVLGGTRRDTGPVPIGVAQ